MARLFADVEKRRWVMGHSIRRICGKLPTLPGYKDRWGSDTPAALRKAYTKVCKHGSTVYELTLCHGQVHRLATERDRIDVAIEHHGWAVAKPGSSLGMPPYQTVFGA